MEPGASETFLDKPAATAIAPRQNSPKSNPSGTKWAWWVPVKVEREGRLGRFLLQAMGRACRDFPALIGQERKHRCPEADYDRGGRPQMVGFSNGTTGTAPLKRIVGAGGIWGNSIRPMVRYGAVRSRDKRWIPNMRYRVIWYNRTTDRVGGLVEIPGVLLSRVLKIAGVTDRNEPGELLLEPRQISDIASLVGLHIDLARFEYHLDPLGPFPQRLRA